MKFFFQLFNLSRLTNQLKAMVSYQSDLLIIVRGPTGSGKTTVAENMFLTFGDQIEQNQKQELHNFEDVVESMKREVGVIIVSNSDPDLDVIKYLSHAIHYNYRMFVIDLMVFIRELNWPNIPSNQVLFDEFSNFNQHESSHLIQQQLTDYCPFPHVAQEVLNYRSCLLCLRDLMDQPYKIEVREVADFMNPAWDDEAWGSEIDREREDSAGESEDIIEDEDANHYDIEEQGAEINEDEEGETECENDTASE